VKQMPHKVVSHPVAIKKERNSNMELLRIIATLFVIIVHYNNKNNGKGFLYTESLQQHYMVLICFEMLAICAVNIFVMISGYFMCYSKKATLTKVFSLYIDVMCCAVIRYFLDCTIGSASFSISKMLYLMIPLSWYVAVYSALYLLSPYLNKLIHSLTASQFRRLLIMGFLVYSVWPSCLELTTALTGVKLTSMNPISTQGSGAGYTIVNFVLLYFIGAYLRIHKNERATLGTRWKSLGVYIACTVLLVLYSKVYFSGAVSYCNPVVIIQTIAIFRVFQSIELKSKSINAIAKYSFGVYLLHGYFFKYFHIEAFTTGRLLLIPFHITVTAILIYAICAVIFCIYRKLAGPIIDKALENLQFLSYEVA